MKAVGNEKKSLFHLKTKKKDVSEEEKTKFVSL